MKPLADRVIVKPLKSEEKSPGGIVIPDTAKERPQEGEVIAVGPGKMSEALGAPIRMSIEAGDKVLFAKYSGTEIKEGEFLIMKESDILAVI